MDEATNPKLRHFTARRGFVVFVGLWVLTLYFMWAFYGAAPTNLSFLTETQSENTGGMAMGGHGSATGAMTPDEFQEIAEKFIEDLSLPDGSVRPTRRWTESMAAIGDGHEDRDDEAGEHRDENEAPGRESSMTGAADATTPNEAARMASSAELPVAVAGRKKPAHGADEIQKPIDVYLMAMQFSYSPRVLRLEKGVRYRFRMMSMDVNHGASIHTGFAGHIMRRPARTMVEMVMTFPVAGEYMMYCTVYCGEGHSQMKGKLIVE